MITYVECPRDSWQGLKKFIPTEEKISYLQKLVESGFKHLDCVSFVSNKAVPQMKDSEEVLMHLPSDKNIDYLGIIANEKGLERALLAKNLTSIGYPFSISETFQQKNTNRSMKDSWPLIKMMRSEASHLRFVVYLSMGFGNPYGDRWNESFVLKNIEKLLNLGIKYISVADTLGQADEKKVKNLCQEVVTHFPGEKIGVHLHARPEIAISLATAALQSGINWLEGALGGVGGCPFAADELVGNIPTELVLPKIQEISGESLVNIEVLSDLAREAKSIKANFQLDKL